MSVDASDLSRGPDASNRTIGVLISGRGSNLQALIDAVADGQLDARIAIVISNRASAAGLARAAARVSRRWSWTIEVSRHVTSSIAPLRRSS